MIPRTFKPTDTSEHIRFYFLVFFRFTLLVVVSVRELKLTHVGFRAHVKIASRIVSYRHFNKVSPRGRRDDIPRRRQFDGGKNRGGSSPTADGSAVRTSLVVGGG